LPVPPFTLLAVPQMSRRSGSTNPWTVPHFVATAATLETASGSSRAFSQIAPATVSPPRNGRAYPYLRPRIAAIDNISGKSTEGSGFGSDDQAQPTLRGKITSVADKKKSVRVVGMGSRQDGHQTKGLEPKPLTTGHTAQIEQPVRVPLQLIIRRASICVFLGVDLQ
jgi:hypothetical protein